MTWACSSTARPRWGACPAPPAFCMDYLCKGVTFSAIHTLKETCFLWGLVSAHLPNSNNISLPAWKSPGQSWHHCNVEHQAQLCHAPAQPQDWVASFAWRPPRTDKLQHPLRQTGRCGLVWKAARAYWKCKARASSLGMHTCLSDTEERLAVLPECEFGGRHWAPCCWCSMMSWKGMPVWETFPHWGKYQMCLSNDPGWGWCSQHPVGKVREGLL